MEEARRPRGRGSAERSIWCHARAYARRVWENVRTGCLVPGSERRSAGGAAYLAYGL
jgi:hypothetical protein